MSVKWCSGSRRRPSARHGSRSHGTPDGDGDHRVGGDVPAELPRRFEATLAGIGHLGRSARATSCRAGADATPASTSVRKRSCSQARRDWSGSIHPGHPARTGARMWTSAPLASNGEVRSRATSSCRRSEASVQRRRALYSLRCCGVSLQGPRDELVIVDRRAVPALEVVRGDLDTGVASRDGRETEICAVANAE